jgi:hypothetical protein
MLEGAMGFLADLDAGDMPAEGRWLSALRAVSAPASDVPLRSSGSRCRTASRVCSRVVGYCYFKRPRTV